MKLSDRINDLFQKYSVQLEVAEGEVPAEVVVDEPQVASKVLSNGTQVYVDAAEFAVGLGVYVLNEEGEKIPLPDGEYELEGGGSLLVVEGMIDAMSEAEVAEEAPAEVVVEAEKEEDEEEEKDKYAKRKARRKLSHQRQSDKRAKDYKLAREAKREVRKLKKENARLLTELAEMQNKSASKPLARRAKSTKTEKVDLASMSTEDRIFNLHNLYK